MKPTRPRSIATGAACVAVALAAAGCGGGNDVAVADPVVPPATFAERCAELARSPGAGVSLTRAAVVEAGAVTPTGAAAALPAHCQLQGAIDARTGADGKPYAIGFELRLPENWNGRFFFQGGGGTDGALNPAYGTIGGGDASSNALTRGFAVASTDGGHLSETDDPFVGGSRFGLDPQARIDYGYNAVDRSTVASKALIEALYRKPPDKSYFVGCSNGGRQAMVAASRFSHFDGIVAGNPGFNLPQAAVQHPWDTQALAAIGAPTLAQSFSTADLARVGAAVLAKCDAADGLVDGMVNDFPACKLTAADLGGVSPAQATALLKMFGGVKNSGGALLYADWPWDAGVSSAGWRSWKMGPLGPTLPFGIIQTLGAGSLPYVFITEPVALGSLDALLGYLLGFDFDRDAPKIFTKTARYTQSSMEFMTPPDLSMARLQARGGKMIVYHGASDPVFSVNDTIRWYDDFNAARGGRGSDFARLFAVPGMTHCSGGPATDRFDMLAAIVDWVEAGKAPERIEAAVRPANADIPAAWGARTRPLCAWPKQVRYQGSGDINLTANFRCE